MSCRLESIQARVHILWVKVKYIKILWTVGGRIWIIKQTAFLLRLDLTSLKYSFMRKLRHDFNTSNPWIPNRKWRSLLQCSCSNTCSSMSRDLFERDVGQLLQIISTNCRALISASSVTFPVLLYRVGFWHCTSAAPPGSPGAWPLLFGRLGAALAMGLRRPAVVLHSSSITACGLQVPEPPSTPSQVSGHLPSHTQRFLPN